jgi:hypothetical protein
MADVGIFGTILANMDPLEEVKSRTLFMVGDFPFTNHMLINAS